MSEVQTIQFKGKPYVTVAERVRQVYEQQRNFEVLDSVFYEVAGRVLCKVTILVDERKYTGSAEAKINNAVPKSADATNPFECAETSALGRALAFAGLGTVDGIASYDEMVRGVAQSTQQEESKEEESPALAQIKARSEQLYPGKWANVKFKLLNANIADSALTAEQIEKIGKNFDIVEQRRAMAAAESAA